MSTPDLTVIVALQNSRATIEACLDSLQSQSEVVPNTLEVIVVDGSQDGSGETVAQRYPTVTLLRRAGVVSLPQLLGIGMAHARGRLVAVTEGSCTFDPHWAANAIAAHATTSNPAIGGRVEPAADLQALELALFFCDYGQFLPPLAAGPTHDLPGNNAVFKRDVLNAGSDFAQSGFWKTRFCQQLEAQGHRLRADPTLLVYYHRRINWGELIRRRYRHGRCFGAMRARSAAGWLRIAYALAAPLMPALLTYKLWRRVWPKRLYRRAFMRTFPLSVLVLTLWSIGEGMGNLFGAGDTCEQL